jgi:octaprenyl-diphosphate synthase
MCAKYCVCSVWIGILQQFYNMHLAKKVLNTELSLFEDYFRQAMKSRVALLDRIMQYIVKRKGKQIRPMFVFLSAKLGGEINESSYRAAAIVELLHTASLVHDDVVDDSMERRGFFSINALWKNKIAVLVGDYMLMKALLLSVDNKEYKILQIFGDAVKKMSEGELLQIGKTRKLNLKEDIYYDIIKGKTASLLASCCAAGSSSTFKDDGSIEKMRLFGEKVGMAFQIKDDLFDYGTMDVGKPTGNDIKEKKLTLPLIYTLNNCDASTKRKIIYIVKNENTDKDKIKFVLDEVKKAGGIEYATKKMFEFRDDALQILNEFAKTEVRDALEELVRYTTDRNY